MKHAKKPAGNRRSAWLLKERGFGAEHFGGVDTDRLDLYEDGYGFAGRLCLETGISSGEITDYQRNLDEDTGIVRVSYQWQGRPVEILAFASAAEDLLYYEMAADQCCLNVRVTFLPERRSAYRNYNLGGFYFETKKREALLIGKGELKADGFPKADETGITVKNASRVAFRIFLKSEKPEKQWKPLVQATQMQMAMNRYLAKTDDLSREALLRLQEKKESKDRETDI